MQCPSCNKELRSIVSHGIALDECAQCGGVWFDAGELKNVIDSQDAKLRWIDFSLFKNEEGKFSRSTGTEACPHCGAAMARLTYAESGAVISACDACEGVWLERGALEKIVVWLEDRIAGASLEQYEHDAGQQFAQIVTGPQGIVAEVKDFLAIAKLLEYRAFTEHPKLLAALNNIENHLPFK